MEINKSTSIYYIFYKILEINIMLGLEIYIAILYNY